jgi:chromosome partitioning protein
LIISIINQKGGVAKTTSTYNLAETLNKLNKSVLMIDLDPQSSLTISTGIEPEELRKTIYDVLCEEEKIENVIIDLGFCSLVPSIIDLSVAEMKLVAEFGRESILKKKISNVSDKYDYILVDCPPSLGILTINALCAANKIIVPFATEYLAVRGMKLLFETVEKVKDFNPGIDLLGIIPTMFDRTLHSKEVLDMLKKDYLNKVFDPISKSVQVRDAVLSNSTIIKESPEHKISKAYFNIAEVIING